MELLRSSYIPPMARERKMRKFLELSHGDKALSEYATQFHHLEKYCPRLFGSEAEKAGKFIWGLGEGIRTKVIGARQDSLVDTIDMTTRFDDDFTHIQEIRKKKEMVAPPSKFRKIFCL